MGYQNDKLIIEAPQGKLYKRVYTKGQNKGKCYARIEWNEGFGPDMTKNLQGAQAIVDSEVMRLMEPYMPLDTGTMIRSMQLTTVVGSGEVKVSTPYALAVLRGKGAVGRPTGPLRGPQYFERFKADKLPELKRKLEAVTGGTVK